MSASKSFDVMTLKKANRPDIRLIMQSCIDPILNGDVDAFDAILHAHDEETRRLVGFCMGHDGNSLIHRLSSGVSSRNIDFFDVMNNHGMLGGIHIPNTSGYFAVHIATIAREMGILHYLVDRGANINQAGVKSSTFRRTPATIAAAGLDTGMLSCLVNLGADLTIKDSNGKDCAQYIAESGDSDLAREFVSIQTVNIAMAEGLVSSKPNDDHAPRRSSRAI